ncbi:MAG TPA: DASS family sodium-coupled anion symporter, partial [Blastocatellia bacterium]|nr:DASS family sodium-coupled anion symporter [Blastocatellia bacterium]
METSPAPRVEEKDRQIQIRNLILKWAITIFSGLAIYLAPVPEGVTPQSWRLLAIFIATIVGSILRPAPGGAMVVLGIAAIALTKSMPLSEALIGAVTDPARPDLKAVETLRIKSTLAGYADPVVWLVLAAFFMSRAMIKTGLGRRIALLFIRAIGHRSLGLGYALVGTDFLLASVIPSNGARSGGIIFPITKSVAETYDSKPGPTARRLGSFLMGFMYQCEVIISATFLTGQAGNLLIQRFAKQQGGIDLNYQTWLLGAIAPSLACLMITPPLLYRLFPPEVTYTPDAAKFAGSELEKMGRMTWREKVMLCVFAFVALMWATTNRLHGVDYSVVAMAGVCLLLLTNVISWEDALAERAAWDVFVWYGGMVRMAEALGESGITRKFAESAAGFTSGWKWWAALGLLALIYFYAHYGFASISAHALAMYTPFLIVVTLAGAPPFLAAALLAYFSNLSAGLTHYGTTPGPIYFGADYVSQQKWWQLGLIASVANILVWASVGLLWWKILGWW